MYKESLPPPEGLTNSESLPSLVGTLYPESLPSLCRVCWGESVFVVRMNCFPRDARNGLKEVVQD